MGTDLQHPLAPVQYVFHYVYTLKYIRFKHIVNLLIDRAHKNLSGRLQKGRNLSPNWSEYCQLKKEKAGCRIFNAAPAYFFVVRPAGFEPAAYGFEVQES